MLDSIASILESASKVQTWSRVTPTAGANAEVNLLHGMHPAIMLRMSRTRTGDADTRDHGELAIICDFEVKAAQLDWIAHMNGRGFCQGISKNTGFFVRSFEASAEN